MSTRHRRAVSAYVVERLKKESLEYGYGFGAHLSEKTGFTPAHISTVLNRHRNPGFDFCAALANYWADVGSYAALERAAINWFGGVENVRERTLARLRQLGAEQNFAAEDIAAAEQARSAWGMGELNDAQILTLLKAQSRAREDIAALGPPVTGEDDFDST